MKLIIAGLSLISIFAHAETTTVTVEGMHCSACRKMINTHVCGDAAIKNSMQSCSVKILDAEKQIGEIVMVTKGESKVDLSKVEKGIASAGDGYKIIKKETK